MAEEIINGLTHLEDLKVVARTSAFSFKGRDVDVRTIGDELGVGTVLEGSVRKAGNRLRITAQLISVADGYHLWSDRFDRKLDDIFAIQDEITERIVETLQVKLQIGTAASKKKRSVDREAYDLYLRALQHRWQQSEDGFRRAVDLLERAVAVDPDFAVAHAQIAQIYNLQASYGYLALEEAKSKVERSGQRSLSLEPRLPLAHTALGYLRGFSWDWDGAKRHLDKAMALAPGDPESLIGYVARYLSPRGHTQDAIEETRKARSLDPLLLVVNSTLGEALFWDRQYEAAIDQFQHVCQMAPDYHTSRSALAAAYSCAGMPEEALRQQQEIYRRLGRPGEIGELERVFSESGELGILQRQRARMVPRAERALEQSGDFGIFFRSALICARLQDTDEAFRWLDEAVTRRDGWVIYTKVHPLLDNLRPDPRFDAILRRMGLT